MDDAELKLNALRERARRAFPGNSVEGAWTALRRAIAHVSIPDQGLLDNGREQLAQNALDKLLNLWSPAPTSEEIRALEEAICLMRPSIFSSRSRLENIPETFQTAFPEWSTFRERAPSLLESVGRLDLCIPGGGVRHVGSGFLVAGRLIATCKHVLKELTGGTENVTPDKVIIRFHMEKNTVADEPVNVSSVVAIHPELDLALLKIEVPRRCPLLIEPTRIQPGHPVVVLGHPGHPREEQTSLLATAVFGDTLDGLKRAAPGEVVAVRSLGSHGTIDHDCSTLKGTSGGPLVSMKTGAVVGIHRHGSFLAHNEAVGALDVEEWIIRERGRE